MTLDAPSIEKALRRSLMSAMSCAKPSPKIAARGIVRPSRMLIRLTPGRFVAAAAPVASGNRRDDVDGARERLVARGRAITDWPAENDGCARATVIGRLFRPGAEAREPTGWCRRLRGFLDPAIIADEDDQRILVEPVLLQVSHELTYGLVEPLAHRVVAGELYRSPWGLILLQKTIRRRMGCKREKRAYQTKNRLSPAPSMKSKIGC